jgi:hypothetical protein
MTESGDTTVTIRSEKLSRIRELFNAMGLVLVIEEATAKNRLGFKKSVFYAQSDKPAFFLDQVRLDNPDNVNFEKIRTEEYASEINNGGALMSTSTSLDGWGSGALSIIESKIKNNGPIAVESSPGVFDVYLYNKEARKPLKTGTQITISHAPI